MKTVTIHKAKTNLSRLIEDVCRGEDIIIARGKNPVAKLVALDSEPMERKPGRLKGLFKVGPEFFDPLPKEELELWWK